MIEPPDLKVCQAIKPNGKSFMSIGGKPGMIRCNNKPTVIATETKAGDDGFIGSMSLCDECMNVSLKQLPQGFCTYKTISA